MISGRLSTISSEIHLGLIGLMGVLLLALSQSANANYCLACHSARDLTKSRDGDSVSLYVDSAAFRSSVHGRLACTDCHADLKGQAMPHKPNLLPAQCASCHKSHEDTVHRAITKDSPLCVDCHGSHYILPKESPSSPLHLSRSETICTSCHDEQATFEPFLRSVHGVAKDDAFERIAGCVQCHPVHTGETATSPSVCGDCHRAELADYSAGSHGSGGKGTPTCFTCHGGHEMPPVTDIRSSVHPLKEPALCGECHEDSLSTSEYDMPADSLTTYRASYHGIANKFGNSKSAVCSSCHGAHKVLPSDNPASSVNPANLRDTCARCHPGMGGKVLSGSVHLRPSRENDRIVYWVNVIYGLFVAAAILAFCGYMAFDLLTHWRTRRRGS